MNAPASTYLVSAVCDDDVLCGQFWKEFLSSKQGNLWFSPWNNFVQAKLDALMLIAEERDISKTDPFRVLMVGDSTMGHQYGAICGFMGEREGRRFDPEEAQVESPGCCMNTLSTEEGGGRGLCFEYDYFRFLDPQRPGRETKAVDAYYFGCGLHLLHMVPSWPASDPMEPLRVQEWLHYEKLLEGVVQAVRTKNGPDVKIAFMTSHTVADERYNGEFADIRDAYRQPDGDTEVVAECQRQVKAAAAGNPRDVGYTDWHAVVDIEAYTNAELEEEEPFTVDTYCREALMDRRGSLQISRRARSVMSRVGVPIVDAGSIVGQEAWASGWTDGRRYPPLVPLEVAALLNWLVAPPTPPPLSSILGAAEESGPASSMEEEDLPVPGNAHATSWRGAWWKEFLSSEEGNFWFDPWNNVIQAKLDALAAIAEAREANKTEAFRVLMVGDSTMRHQFALICGFMGERDGRWYDPEEAQQGPPGCCMDTLPSWSWSSSSSEGGEEEDQGEEEEDDRGERERGRGVCFEYDEFRFLDPKRPDRTTVDAYYFGSGLHMLHMYPHWPEMNPMEPLRIQSWLNYENLLEGVVNAVREKNGPDVIVAFMTNHAIADELFEGEYREIRAAYRVGEGNATIRAECQRQNNTQVREAALGNPADFEYNDWHGKPDISEYVTTTEGHGPFTVDTYCEEAILDRRGSLQLSRRARPVMSRLEVPVVDAARLVEGQAWASRANDGRHFPKIVPIEVVELLDILGAPPPFDPLPDRRSTPVVAIPDSENPILTVVVDADSTRSP